LKLIISIGKFFHLNIYSYVAHDCVIERPEDPDCEFFQDMRDGLRSAAATFRRACRARQEARERLAVSLDGPTGAQPDWKGSKGV
jgi:hypothetical protein